MRPVTSQHFTRLGRASQLARTSQSQSSASDAPTPQTRLFVPVAGFRTMMDIMGVTPYYDLNASDAVVPNGTFYDDEDEYDYKDDHAELRQSLNIMSLIVYCLAFVLGVLGNGVVIWVTGFKMKKTVNTVWFLNLAVADFLFTAFLPLSVTYTAMDFHWPFGKFMCKLNSTMSFLNMFASVYILMVISVDRCVSVVWPVWAQNYRSVQKASCVSLGVWILALILSTPYFIFRDTGPSYNNEEIINCFNNFAFSDDYVTPHVTQLRYFRHQAMTMTRFFLGFVIPFTVIVSCYAVIIHRLRRNRTLASQSSRPFKIIAAVITTFFLCWAPFHVLALIELVNHVADYESEILDHVITIGVPIATSLAYLNSCLNPLLYVFMGQDFKDKVRKSILKVLETAFQEEISRSYTYTNSMVTTRSKDKSLSEAE
ncbi:chemerin-like receptor 1 isoform X2 [Syngnathoides biaculeatus]|nr:chemerin-like receptor 1 isoform X2 [Syngnathoides biaculeatus]